MSVTLETTEVLTTTKKLVVTMRLVLTDNNNEHHVYTIPQCIYDPKISLDILGVPVLGTFFGDNVDVHIPLA